MWSVSEMFRLVSLYFAVFKMRGHFLISLVQFSLHKFLSLSQIDTHLILEQVNRPAFNIGHYVPYSFQTAEHKSE